MLHLAAQPGVRYSITHPFEYETSNVGGVLSIPECRRRDEVERRLALLTGYIDRL